MAIYQYSLDHTQEHEVLTLAAARKQLKLEDDVVEENDFIQDCIDGAIEIVEGYCNISINESKVLFTAYSFEEIASLLEFRVSPVQAITFVKYLDTANDLQTLNTDKYALLPVDKYASKIEFLTTDLPEVKERTHNAVQIEFLLGYAEDKTPKSLISAIKLVMGWLFKNRDDRPDKLPMASQRIMNKHVYIPRS